LAERAARVVLLAVALLALAAAAPALAADSDAPKGAGPTWLPKEDWVRYRQLPYDEQRLYTALGIDRGRLLEWLRDDRRTIAQLAARRGWRDPRRLASRLVGDWRGRVPRGRLAILRSRALRTLTQGHLGQHMFFHIFHHQSVRKDARRIFGVSPDEYRTLRYKGLTPYQIGARGGRTRARVFRLTLARFREDGRKAVRERWMPAAEARRQLALQRKRLDWWLDRGLPKLGSPEPEGPPLDTGDDDLDQNVSAGHAAGASLLCSLEP
jgi:hypothetical protein